MTLRLPPTSACAAAARRPSPVPRARVRRCPARVARSRRRADRQGSAGQEAWRGMAVRRSPSCLAPPWLLTLRWIDVHRIVANYWSSAGRAGRRRSCCSTAQGGAAPGLPSLQQQCRQVGSLASAVDRQRPPLLRVYSGRTAAAAGCRHSAQAAERHSRSRGSRSRGTDLSSRAAVASHSSAPPPPPPAGLPPRTLLTPNPSPSQRLRRRC